MGRAVLKNVLRGLGYCPGFGCHRDADPCGKSGVKVKRQKLACRHKAKDIIPLIAWRREAWKEEALDDLP